MGSEKVDFKPACNQNGRSHEFLALTEEAGEIYTARLPPQFGGGRSMNITITGRHMEMTEALKQYIEGALGKVTAHFDKVIDADVILDVEKHRHIAEVNLHANGVRINGKEASEDMYQSVDAVMAKIDKQVRKYKERINRHTPRSAKEARQYKSSVITAGETTEATETAEAVVTAHRVVQHESLDMHPHSVDEAIMHLDLTDDLFLVFVNADSSQVNVLYKHKDGTYGLIEPQF